MEKYNHISYFENILNEQSDLVASLHALVQELKDKKPAYDELIDYYYSAQREQDLTDDEQGLIPQDLKRGVLSQDAIYNLMVDYQELIQSFSECIEDIEKDA